MNRVDVTVSNGEAVDRAFVLDLASCRQVYFSFSAALDLPWRGGQLRVPCRAECRFCMFHAGLFSIVWCRSLCTRLGRGAFLDVP